MKHRFAALAVLIAAGVAACSPQEPAAPAASGAPAAPPPAPGPDAVSQATLMDTKGNAISSDALAGTFAEADSELVLQADGTYRQTLTTAGTQLSSDGVWIPAGRSSIALTPLDKAGGTVRFTLVSVDDMRSQDGLHHFKRKSAQ
jgi:ABC-type glycerol-3-phosphate transport system substrate-binding protein